MSPPTKPPIARGLRDQMEQRGYDVAMELIGTCRGIYEFAAPGEVEDKTFCAALDENAFECDCCGWWHSTDELRNDDGKQLCEDCWRDNNGGGDD